MNVKELLFDLKTKLTGKYDLSRLYATPYNHRGVRKVRILSLKETKKKGSYLTSTYEPVSDLGIVTMMVEKNKFYERFDGILDGDTSYELRCITPLVDVLKDANIQTQKHYTIKEICNLERKINDRYVSYHYGKVKILE